MDMYQKRKMRKENKNTNIEDNKSIAKTNINWYPGHMAKTKRLITENINLIDINKEIDKYQLLVDDLLNDYKLDLINKDEYIETIKFLKTHNYVI